MYRRRASDYKQLWWPHGGQEETFRVCPQSQLEIALASRTTLIYRTKLGLINHVHVKALKGATLPFDSHHHQPVKTHKLYPVPGDTKNQFKSRTTPPMPQNYLHCRKLCASLLYLTWTHALENWSCWTLGNCGIATRPGLVLGFEGQSIVGRGWPMVPS